MKRKEIILIQAIICCMIFTFAKTAAMLMPDEMLPVKDRVKTKLEKNYTVDEVKDAGSELLETVKETPAVIAGAIHKANKLSEFGQPIDEASDRETACVYATNDGKVISSGISKELGTFIKIQHEESVSTYGNLETVMTVQGDKVKKGDIIGTYDKDSSKKFYYDLEENLQT